MHKTLGLSVALLALALATGCGGKKEDGPKSGLAWTPSNYGEMSATCKKALACCEDYAKGNGAKTAEDFNGKCSGPALWKKDSDCDTDMKSRVVMLKMDKKPVPPTCE